MLAGAALALAQSVQQNMGETIHIVYPFNQDATLAMLYGQLDIDCHAISNADHLIRTRSKGGAHRVSCSVALFFPSHVADKTSIMTLAPAPSPEILNLRGMTAVARDPEESVGIWDKPDSGARC